jgi:hypothetical protein
MMLGSVEFYDESDKLCRDVVCDMSHCSLFDSQRLDWLSEQLFGVDCNTFGVPYDGEDPIYDTFIARTIKGQTVCIYYKYN